MDANYHASQPPVRLEYLDALRGVAILMVVAFHSYARWYDSYPYAAKFENNILLNSGIAGVELFFLISGFVILLTIERTKSFIDFILKRWFRLFPAMLICSVVIFETVQIFPNRPTHDTQLVNLIPGLTLLGQKIPSVIFGREVGSIEGAFWSLYVEVRFYIIFGMLYFCAGPRVALPALYALGVMGNMCEMGLGGAGMTCKVMDVAGCQYFLWFAAGALLYKFSQNGNLSVFIAALCAIAIEAITSPNLVMTLFAATIFILPLFSKKLCDLLSNKILLYLGFISYPFYLLHENMLVSMISSLGRLNIEIPAILIPVLPFLAICALAGAIAKYVEPVVKGWISILFQPFRRWAVDFAENLALRIKSLLILLKGSRSGGHR